MGITKARVLVQRDKEVWPIDHASRVVCLVIIVKQQLGQGTYEQKAGPQSLQPLHTGVLPVDLEGNKLGMKQEENSKW